MICTIVLLGIGLAHASLPNVITNAINRAGRQAEVRVLNRLDIGSRIAANFNVNGNTVTSLTDSVSVNVLHGTIVQQVISPVKDAISTFETIDASAGSAQLRADFNLGSITLQLQCTGSVSQSQRVTFLVKSVVNSEPIFPSTCSAVGGTCSAASTPSTKGSITVSCTAINTADLSLTRTCATVPVRFYNERDASSCPLFVENIDKTVGDEKAFLTAQLVGLSKFETSQDVFDAKRTGNFRLSTTQFVTAVNKDRFVDVFVPKASAPVVQTFATGFINVANLAHRQDANAVLTNTFKVVVLSDTNDITVRKNVVHVATVAPASSMGFIEVPAGKPYFVQVFDSTVSDATLFGDTAVSAATVAATTPLTTLTLGNVGSFFAGGSLQAGELAIFRIVTNGASVGPTSPAAVPLNGNSLAQDQTRAIVWNNIETVSVKFAAPAADCCNYGFNTRTAALNNGGVASTLLSGPSDIASFDVFPGTASDKCSLLGSSTLIGQANALTFTRATGGSCSADGVILNGRSVQFQKANVIAGCTTPSAATITANKIVAQNTASPLPLLTAEPSESTNLQLRFTATFCDCASLAPACTVPTCEEQRTQLNQVAAISGQIAASTAAVTAAVTASQNSLAVVLADTNADVGNTNATLLAAINARTSSLASGITRIEGDVEDVLDDFDDFGDDLDDLADSIDDKFDSLQGAVEDLE
jgi:hypothetical protein